MRQKGASPGCESNVQAETEQNEEHYGMNKKNKDKAQSLQSSNVETCSRVQRTREKKKKKDESVLRHSTIQEIDCAPGSNMTKVKNIIYCTERKMTEQRTDIRKI